MSYTRRGVVWQSLADMAWYHRFGEARLVVESSFKTYTTTTMNLEVSYHNTVW
jgi:hypothetical protein